MKLDGRVAIVTGAGSGIGRAIAFALSKEGAKVVVADMNLDAAEETMKEISETKNNSFAITTDVTKGSDVDTMVTKTLEQFGRVDILVNNVGIPGSQEATVLHSTPDDEWDRVVAVNLKSVYLCCLCCS